MQDADKGTGARRSAGEEVIVDLFAGIGYFTLPILVHSRPRLVFACEWNPAAVEGLRAGLKANGVPPERCSVLEGDNRVVAPVGVADRVLLGLIPSSEGSWRTAVLCLKEEGGVMHVHGNVREGGEGEWMRYVEERMSGLAEEEGRGWEVKVRHLEKVKWYAPRVRHVVADVMCERK